MIEVQSKRPIGNLQSFIALLIINNLFQLPDYFFDSICYITVDSSTVDLNLVTSR